MIRAYGKLVRKIIYWLTIQSCDTWKMNTCWIINYQMVNWIKIMKKDLHLPEAPQSLWHNTAGFLHVLFLLQLPATSSAMQNSMSQYTLAQENKPKHHEQYMALLSLGKKWWKSVSLTSHPISYFCLLSERFLVNFNYCKHSNRPEWKHH